MVFGHAGNRDAGSNVSESDEAPADHSGDRHSSNYGTAEYVPSVLDSIHGVRICHLLSWRKARRSTADPFQLHAAR